MIGRAVRRTAAAIVAVSTVAGCGLLGNTSSSQPGTSGPLELASITVSVLQAIDSAPLWHAVDAGYFDDEGLTVEPVAAKSGPAAVQAVISDSAEIGLTSYPAAFTAQAKENAPGGLMLVADGYAAAPNTFMVVAAPGSGIRAMTPRDLAGRRIAVSDTGTISDLATMSTLETQDVDLSTIDWVAVPFPDMIATLKSGQADAAVMVEPFITQVQMQLGEDAPLIVDCAVGPTHEIPLAGWMSTKAFVDQNPKTVAAFQRGLARAAADIQNRSILTKILVDHLDIDETTAALLTPGRFPSALDQTRLERVVDLMHRYRTVTNLPDDFDLAPMLAPQQPAR